MFSLCFHFSRSSFFLLLKGHFGFVAGTRGSVLTSVCMTGQIHRVGGRVHKGRQEDHVFDCHDQLHDELNGSFELDGLGDLWSWLGVGAGSVRLIFIRGRERVARILRSIRSGGMHMDDRVSCEDM